MLNCIYGHIVRLSPEATGFIRINQNCFPQENEPLDEPFIKNGLQQEQVRREGEGEDEGGPVLIENASGDPLHSNISPSHDLTTLSHSGQVYIKVFNMEY